MIKSVIATLCALVISALVISALVPLLLIVPLVGICLEKLVEPQVGLAGLGAGFMVFYGAVFLWGLLAIKAFFLSGILIYRSAKRRESAAARGRAIGHPSGGDSNSDSIHLDSKIRVAVQAREDSQRK